MYVEHIDDWKYTEANHCFVLQIIAGYSIRMMEHNSVHIGSHIIQYKSIHYIATEWDGCMLDPVFDPEFWRPFCWRKLLNILVFELHHKNLLQDAIYC